MNRLILLGNGFDLAHGLPTSYNNFIIWYIKHAFLTCHEENSYKDNLIEIQNLNRHISDITVGQIKSIIENLYNESKLHLIPTSQGIEVNYNGMTYPIFRVNFCSELLSNLFHNCNHANWVDIENEFYKLLKNILRLKPLNKDKLKELNEALSDLIEYLNIYLDELPNPPKIEEYQTLLTSLIEVSDFPDHVGPVNDIQPDETMFLNFNYTDTVEQYLEEFQEITRQSFPPIVNYIHGRVNDEGNPIVFGFGDELDSAYTEMEQQPLNGFFHFTKSFWYFNALNYRKLLNFIRIEPYQIYIVGQSCGLSDRTLLSMLFTHKNCKSIKIYYHGDDKYNNYREITHQIGRHFNDKNSMREIIVPSPLCKRMPQFDD